MRNEIPIPRPLNCQPFNLFLVHQEGRQRTNVQANGCHQKHLPRCLPLDVVLGARKFSCHVRPISNRKERPQFLVLQSPPTKRQPNAHVHVRRLSKFVESPIQCSHLRIGGLLFLHRVIAHHLDVALVPRLHLQPSARRGGMSSDSSVWSTSADIFSTFSFKPLGLGADACPAPCPWFELLDSHGSKSTNVASVPPFWRCKASLATRQTNPTWAASTAESPCPAACAWPKPCTMTWGGSAQVLVVLCRDSRLVPGMPPIMSEEPVAISTPRQSIPEAVHHLQAEARPCRSRVAQSLWKVTRILGQSAFCPPSTLACTHSYVYHNILLFSVYVYIYIHPSILLILILVIVIFIVINIINTINIINNFSVFITANLSFARRLLASCMCKQRRLNISPASSVAECLPQRPRLQTGSAASKGWCSAILICWYGLLLGSIWLYP